MARRKQITPMQRINSGEIMQSLSDAPQKRAVYTNGHASPTAKSPLRPQPRSAQKETQTQHQPSLLTLLTCVAGIYASFLTWGILQERITTTAYSPPPRPRLPILRQPVQQDEYFRFPVVLNTIQAFFAFTCGSLYLLYKTRGSARGFAAELLPSPAAVGPLALVTVTTTLASPFGYAALGHVDYLTFVLAKSCKLLPVMALHVTLFRKRYPLSKYMIVLAVTGGVALFTIYHPPKAGKAKAKQDSSLYGLSLLGINLLFDGLTNTVQDHIFQSPHLYGKTSGPQMMVLLNLFSTMLMSTYLLVTPYLPPILTAERTTELAQAISFLSRHPPVLNDVLLFSAAGAIGQLFIYATLERFSSLLLVTVTVTRKMCTMVLSVLWFGHTLGRGQWAGVGLVFGGIGAEAWVARGEKKGKGRERKKVAGKER